MAPVLPRQSHSIPGLYPPIKGAPPMPFPGPENVTLQMVLELFAGTFGIFVFAVLFWKLGKFIRRFSRHKVIDVGSTPTSRYAKTWYGWVPLQRHKALKSVAQKCFGKVQHWATWNSLKNDYRSVWWNPSQRELEASKRAPMPQRLRTRLRSCRATAVNFLSSPYRNAFTLDNGTEGYSFPRMTGVLQADIMPDIGGEKYNLPKRRHRRRCPSAQNLFRNDFMLAVPAKPGKPITPALNYDTTRKGRRPMHSLIHIKFLSLSQSIYRPRGSDLAHYFPYHNPSIKRDYHSLPCLSDLKVTFQRVPRVWDISGHTLSTTGHHTLSKALRTLRCSRKYQIWSARMALNTPRCVRHSTRRLLVPPGSPRSELFASFSSHQSSLIGMISKYGVATARSSFSGSSNYTTSDARKHSMTYASLIDYQTKYITTDGLKQSPVPHRHDRFPNETSPSADIYKAHFQSKGGQSPPSRLHETIFTREDDKQGNSQARNNIRKLKKNKLAQITIPLKYLSNWEIMFIDGMNRKLEWLSQQLTPGRRPFHFAMLPNHWLNTRTWIVYDPASRVPIDMKRRLGDPRFNRPYPMPDRTPKRKYPQLPRRVASTPRIDSWRVAVNENRRTSGLKDLVKPIELYDGSAENPSDGHIDPACWILRRPPQGFDLSARQYDAYYEGGSGWQEKLGDWQKVRRGYRIRKAIHEGRANRTRAKELAVGAARYCQMARSRLEGMSAAQPGNP